MRQSNELSKEVQVQIDCWNKSVHILQLATEGECRGEQQEDAGSSTWTFTDFQPHPAGHAKGSAPKAPQ